MLENYNLILTLEDACEILNLGTNSVYDLLKKKELAGFKKKNKWFIPKSSILKFIEDNLKNNA